MPTRSRRLPLPRLPTRPILDRIYAGNTPQTGQNHRTDFYRTHASPPGWPAPSPLALAGHLHSAQLWPSPMNTCRSHVRRFTWPPHLRQEVVNVVYPVSMIAVSIKPEDVVTPGVSPCPCSSKRCGPSIGAHMQCQILRPPQGR